MLMGGGKTFAYFIKGKALMLEAKNLMFKLFMENISHLYIVDSKLSCVMKKTLCSLSYYVDGKRKSQSYFVDRKTTHA